MRPCGLYQILRLLAYHATKHACPIAGLSLVALDDVGAEQESSAQICSRNNCLDEIGKLMKRLAEIYLGRDGDDADAKVTVTKRDALGSGLINTTTQ